MSNSTDDALQQRGDQRGKNMHIQAEARTAGGELSAAEPPVFAAHGEDKARRRGCGAEEQIP